MLRGRANGADGSILGNDSARLTGAELRPSWIAQSERGQTLALRLITWIALTFGRSAARVLIYPICLYFLLFSVTARAASRKYLRKVLEREPLPAHLLRHYHAFAATILDRVFLLKGEYRRFEVRLHGQEIVDDIVRGGEGCLLLGAHLGSFEVTRTLATQVRGLRVSMVMYEENARKMNAVLARLNPGAALHVIPLGRMDSMLKVEDALARGELVGILADRTIAGEGTVTRRFLGEPAQFPVGPFRIAAMLKRPIILMFGLYLGGNRYDIHFERLADARGLERAQRDTFLDSAVSDYVSRLEHYCRLVPYNWFNFYDYWK